MSEPVHDARRDCGMCHVPLGSAKCSHVWEHNDEVTMARSEWRELIATTDRYRRAISELDPDGYENGEYDA